MTKQYDTAFENLVKEFVKRYYTYDDGSSQDYDIGLHNHLGLGPINIGDEYWGIDDIYVAVKNNIDRDKLFERYDYSLETHIKNETLPEGKKEIIINLYNYVNGYREYTKEEQEKDKKAIKESYDMLKDCIDSKLFKVNNLKIVGGGIKEIFDIEGIKEFDYSDNGKVLKIVLFDK